MDPKPSDNVQHATVRPEAMKADDMLDEDEPGGSAPSRDDHVKAQQAFEP